MRLRNLYLVLRKLPQVSEQCEKFKQNFKILIGQIIGASSDLKQATSIAQHMVKDWGMSERVGLRTIESQKGLVPNEVLSANTIDNVTKNIFGRIFIILNIQF